MPLKVIIVGGSVTGLSLANMLERHGIDYVLLEAYPNIAPQLGASIGIAPNGLRILDQLGCYDQIRDMAEDYDKGTELRDLSGQDRLPSAVHRQTNALAGLVGKIRHKDRVLTGKRVVQIEMDNESARVHTQDGSTYEGDIVVGADGVHSATRAEMWRLANQEIPGTFDADEELNLDASAKCIFGISRIPSDFPQDMQHLVTGKGVSYMVTPGPGDRLYWFLFVSMPTVASKLVPKWTKADEEELAAQRFEDKITDKITFGDIYRNRRATALVSLEEHVFPRWHFGRIVTLGDAAHKVHPLTALGGNGAMESATILCNALVQRLEKISGGLQNVDVENAFLEVESRQLRRAQGIVKEGKMFQRWVNQLYPLSGLVLRYLLPFANEGVLFGSTLKVCFSAPRIESLPVPNRLHSVLWDDEKPKSRSRGGWAAWSTGVLALGFIVYNLMHCKPLWARLQFQ